jgi:hypothetical protein
VTDTYLVYAQNAVTNIVAKGSGEFAASNGSNNINIIATPGNENVVTIGVQGPAGPSGSVGPSGPAGPAGESNLSGLRKVSIPLQTGILDYVLDDVAVGVVLAFVNGIETSTSIDGVNIHIDDLTPGEVDNSDILTIYY